ncbi:kinase-like protein [Cylindrobasidium torrendii FP15055 ss-10]|uniref:Kinase-like protein n=1 Tax=Cylindrobasidium torrendii FP15055 ss-10 TaxID=1314674 RepID=A0A0D7BMV8_9AGAR|nr:kinase-like protein [Cylindrobasidium torrendii FP15055 ss-10]
MSSNNEIYAIKRVALDKTDQDTMQGFLNEISLLKRLEGHPRIITLIDSELKQGSGGTKGALCLVLELGEIDLAKLLGERQQQGFDMVWVAYYWQQMLQAVQILHDEKIVHSDLKPANFVLVKGQLKLIDFGIANAIANDTTNIQRDHQIGTVNYMSPEAIEIQEGMKRIKVGRPSDVWSLGCILYQMVYGHPPFQALHVYQKMKAIPDESYAIDFPAYVSRPPPKQLYPDHSPPAPPKPRIALRQDVLKTMKSCLTRNPKERMTIPELLEQDWVEMADSHSGIDCAKAPPPRPALSEDETIISPHYMRQLIEYGIRLGQDIENKGMYSSEWLDHDAQRLVRELKKVIESEMQEAQATSSDAFAASGAA